MKIALLGNTCNNNFSLMRYFCDLGEDAHLILFKNEGTPESNPQYSPDWDTYDIEKWSNRIHRIPIPNGVEPIVGRIDKLKLRISKNKLKSYFDGYDCYIGSGISPSIFSRIDKRLTIFFPYSNGVEWVGEDEFKSKLRKINLETLFRYYVKYKQIDGIKKSKVCINSELGPTLNTLNIIGKDCIKMYMPMYYNRDLSNTSVDNNISKLIIKLKEYDFKVISHMRHVWDNSDRTFSNTGFQINSKHNDWLIKGFHIFASNYNNSKPILLLSEWGKDVDKSKELIKSLGIDDKVIWIPMTSRKNMVSIMRQCDVSVGNLGHYPGLLWGGTTWESLANGIPTLQTINFRDSDYIDRFGHELPPVLDVKSENDVFVNLCNMYIDQEARVKLGKESKKWFDEYNGISLAKKWLKILHKNCL